MDEKKNENISQGVIGEIKEDGNPVVYNLDVSPIPESKKKTLPWLTIISWKYDGKNTNGMPPKNIFERMVELQDEIEKHVVKIDFCEHTNSRTGNNLKELTYYISDREKFMEKFNETFAKKKRYPIEINFYHDPEWKEHEVFRKLFSNKITDKKANKKNEE